MREILFRGKRLDNGEWYYGSYLFLHIASVDWTGAKRRNPEDVHYIVNDQDINYAVYPSTVGQYTGLKDKNRKRIFEGDILHIAKISDGLGGYYQRPFDYHVNVVVKWDLCAWMWETLCEDKRYISFPDAWCHYECEVIGNIHDNPGLLDALEGGGE